MDFAQDITLENNRAQLRPLSAADFEALQPVAFDPDLWQFTLTRGDDRISLAAYIAAAVQGREQQQRYPFLIIDKQTNQVAGSTSYYNIHLEDARLSIGYTWVGTAFQRSGLNRAAKHLLFRHAFDVLGCERVELETDAQNLKSQSAMRRMGATEEGTLRSHRYTQGGRRRDTVVFSVLKPEWQQLRTTTFKYFESRG
ncbi:GCN5-related N-acetyltransferase [Hymenobacter roseosalivarius DSM 11622]|uniref:GCN5-related N-acetyltransferase n=1 Tax=Hymenobacter roseosalivarius DSM 11622 TaxID=645990 RepID=A0A1W1UPC8_9BACT|nr:GNAT family protein [Hymenobacter roseosalivarius]SMB82883.1 GCN5-related N-acetyltransferase [Hymenobacter roseosalivarius DSM 11622]